MPDIEHIWGESSACERKFQDEQIPDVDFIRAEIERMRTHVIRQRKEILQLQRAGISTALAELLLARMYTKIDGLCAERDRLDKSEPARKLGALGGRSW
jgi:hypothetical protein